MYLSDKLHPQTISVVETRTDALGIEVVIGDVSKADFSNRDFSGVLFQYPNTDGTIEDYTELVQNAHAHGVSAFWGARSKVHSFNEASFRRWQSAPRISSR